MIQINDTLRDLIPPLSLEESKQLTTNILEEGIREPIILWKGTIVDGHNRYRIAQDYDLDFETVEKHFDSLEDAKLWMIDNQFGRRNLKLQDRAELAIQYEIIEAKLAKDRQISAGEGQSPVTEAGNARDIAAKKAGVSSGYVAQHKKIKEDVETIEDQETKDLAEAYLNKEEGVSQKDVVKKIKEVKKKKLVEDTKKEREITIDSYGAEMYHESCVDFLSRFEDRSVDLLLTDPPYSTDIDDMDSFLDMWLSQSLRKVKDTGRAFICIGAYPKELHNYLGRLLYADGWIVDNPLIWTYRNTLGQTPNMKYNLNYQVTLHLYKETSTPLDKRITNEMFSVQDINAPDGRLGDRYHTWQKPDELAKRFISHTTKEGDTVIDPFACTGTFILNAARLGRRSFGCDIDENAIQIFNKRQQNNL